MKQQRHTPLYVPAYSVGQGRACPQEFFHGLWRAVVCLCLLVALLAGVAYADGEPDGDEVEWIDIQDVLDQLAEDQEPGDAPSLDPDPEPWVDPGYVPDAYYSVQPYSTTTATYWSSSDISNALTHMSNISSRTLSILNSLKPTEGEIWKVLSDIRSLLGNGTSGHIVSLLNDIVVINRTYLKNIDANIATLGNLIISTNSKLDTVNSNLLSIRTMLGTLDTASLGQKLDTVNTNLEISNYKLDQIGGKLNTVNTNLVTVQSKLDTVNTNLVTVQSKLDTVNTNLVNIYDRLNTTNTHLANIYSRLLKVYDLIVLTNQKLDTANSHLSSLLSLLVSGSVRTLSNNLTPLADQNIVFSSLLPVSSTITPPSSIGSSAYFYTESSTGAISYLSSSTIASGNVLWRSSGSSSYRFFEYSRSSQPVFLTPGSYTAVFYIVGTNISYTSGSPSFWFTYSNFSSNFYRADVNLQSRPYGKQSIVYLSSFNLDQSQSFWGFCLSTPPLSVTDGYFYVFLYRNSDVAYTDKVMGDSVNSGQAGATQELQQVVDQTEAFEQKMFQDVSKYTSQLNFGLGDWVEAAAGISYIGSVFMLIWDNSPVQPIVLSLMLGLCMLLLGRGARVADAAPRSEGEERVSSFKSGKGR